jgi:hypothetical protein
MATCPVASGFVGDDVTFLCLVIGDTTKTVSFHPAIYIPGMMLVALN